MGLARPPGQPWQRVGRSGLPHTLGHLVLGPLRTQRGPHLYLLRTRAWVSRRAEIWAAAAGPHAPPGPAAGAPPPGAQVHTGPGAWGLCGGRPASQAPFSPESAFCGSAWVDPGRSVPGSGGNPRTPGRRPRASGVNPGMTTQLLSTPVSMGEGRPLLGAGGVQGGLCPRLRAGLGLPVTAELREPRSGPLLPGPLSTALLWELGLRRPWADTGPVPRELGAGPAHKPSSSGGPTGEHSRTAPCSLPA